MEPTTRPFLCPCVCLDVVEVDYAYLLVFCRRELNGGKQGPFGLFGDDGNLERAT